MADKLYSIIVQRRTQQGQVALQFSDQERAEKVYSEIVDQTVSRLGPPGTRPVYVDDFGGRAALDPVDIGNVIFMDVAQMLEQQAVQAMMTNRVNIEVQERARRDQVMAQSKGPIILPQHGGMPS